MGSLLERAYRRLGKRYFLLYVALDNCRPLRCKSDPVPVYAVPLDGRTTARPTELTAEA
jgi:hypothetical protein